MSKGKMFRKYPLCGVKGNLFFFLYNPVAFLYRFFSPSPKEQPLKKEMKILVCCEAALGDVFLATSILPFLQEKFPQSELGFLCKKESSFVLSTEKRLKWVHVSEKGKKRDLLKEVKEKKYDVSLEMHPFFKSSICFVKKAGIPIRIGFDSGGYDVWLTSAVSFPKKVEYLPNLYSLILEKMGINVLKPRPEPTLLPFSMPLPKDYVVLHMGTSNPLKQWPIENWRSLSLYLRERGCFLVFTGKGAAEKKLIEEIAEPSEDFCDRLNWNEFAGVIKNAQFVVSVDSVSLHLAAFFNVRAVGLYLYNHGVELWLPESENITFLISEKCRYREKPSNALYLKEVHFSDVRDSLNKSVF